MIEVKADRLVYNFIISAFETTCGPLGITKEMLPSYTAFMSYEKFLNISRSLILFYKEGIGCVALKTKNEKTFEVKWLCVDDESRNKGNGKRLLEFCQNYSQSENKTQLLLGCYKENENLINWYKKNGFEIRKNKGKGGLICFMKKEI